MSYNYWVSLHQHTDASNAGGYFEIVSKPEDYIKYAKKYNLPAVSFTEHGNVAMWIKKKDLVESAGLKYIHGIEAYSVMDLADKNRGYHTILLAKNYNGVKEINQLSSDSFNRKDGHFYYRPRILFSDLKEAVAHGNIIVTTACLAGPISQNLVDPDIDEEESKRRTEILNCWLDLAKENRDNVYLEVQPHDNVEQARLNNALQNYARTYDLKLIAANDIHAINQEHDRLRKIIKKGKHNGYDNDDQFELWCKTRSEMVDAFTKQGVLTSDNIQKALDATVDIAESVEEFEIDKSHKYPKLYENPEAEFKKRIKHGLIKRGINKLPKDEQNKYVQRVNREYKVYKHNGAIDYMLSHEDIMNAAKEHGAHFGPGRGSVSGSLIAYLCGQTDMDSLKLGLNFERFMNPERISLADIDVDAYKPDQQWIQQWILTNPKWHAASIMTANTYGLKAAIKAVADGMERYAGKPAYIQSIRNRIGDDGFIPTDLYEEHQQLIDDAKKVVGVIDSFGRHAAGIVIDTNTIDDTMGTQTISGWDYKVSQIAMTEIESRRWVKYDVLGLDNIGLISRAAELAGIPFPTPDSDFIDFEDEKVWNSMREDNIGVFQMEGDRAGKLLRDMLSPETIANIRSNEAGKDVKYMDLLSLVNAAQRPSGASYVDAVTHGKFKDNGHPALNKFLAPTLGELVYQEQILNFLVEFCGYSAGKADVIRRGIGHKIKSVMDEEVPKIKDAFINTMITKYNDTKEHAEKIANDFIQVFMDAANYGFSINHSMAYSYIGYISTWLRYNYPVEWCTAAFQIWDGKQDKLNRVFKFAKENGISLKPVKFRKSKGSYYMDTQDKIIYEGTASIKGANGISGDDLYLLRDKHYQLFSELLLDIFEHKSVILDDKECPLSRMYLEFDDDKIANIDQSLNKYLKKVKVLTKTKVAINRRSLVNLILLDFFDEFGNNLKLKKVFDYFNKNYKPNNKRFLGKAKAFRKCVAYEQQIDNDKLPLIDQLSNELNLLGRCQTNNENLPAQYAFISDVVERSNKVQVTLYSVKRGVEAKAFIAKRTYNILKLAKGQLIKINRTSTRRKNVMVDGHWRKSNDSDLWVDDYVIIKG